MAVIHIDDVEEIVLLIESTDDSVIVTELVDEPVITDIFPLPA